GLRTDSGAFVGYAINPNFDSLLAKLIAQCDSPSFADAVARAARGLDEFRIEGVRSNAPLLRRLLQHPQFIANRIDTQFIDDHLPGLAAAGGAVHPAALDRHDPLAVLEYGKRAAPVTESLGATDGGDGVAVLRAPMQGTIVELAVSEGDLVRAGQPLLIM